MNLLLTHVSPQHICPLGMNVIMPTAMVTMHKDPDLASNSLKTSRRGIKVLKELLNKPGAIEQCKAILNVAIGNVETEDGNIKVGL